MTDSAGKILFVNRSYREFLGITAEQGRDLDYTQFIHPDDRDTYLAAFRTALDTRQTFHHQVRLRRVDGEWRWFESRGNPIFDAAGNMTGFIGSSPDITDIYQSQQALRELGQRKDEFLANMSHEIRSPLTAIMGYADILLSRLNDPEDIECLRTIKESGDYLIEIINDILDLSKVEAGKLVLNIQPISIHSLLSEVQALMNGRAKQKGLSLDLRYDGVLPETLQSDRTRLRQILLNLVSNAIKFTERGKVEIVAKFSAQSLLEIDVVDTGVGIAPEHQKILFSAVHSGRHDERAAVRRNRPGSCHYAAARRDARGQRLARKRARQGKQIPYDDSGRIGDNFRGCRFERTGRCSCAKRQSHERFVAR